MTSPDHVPACSGLFYVCMPLILLLQRYHNQQLIDCITTYITKCNTVFVIPVFGHILYLKQSEGTTMQNTFMSKPTTKLSNTTKTKMITFRCPNDVADLLPGKDRTEWLLDAAKEKLSRELLEIDTTNFDNILNETLKHRREVSKHRREELAKQLFSE